MLKPHLSVSFVANYVLSLFIYLFIYFEVLLQQEVEYCKVESFMETMSKSSFNLYCMVIFMSEAGQAAKHFVFSPERYKCCTIHCFAIDAFPVLIYPCL